MGQWIGSRDLLWCQAPAVQEEHIDLAGPGSLGSTQHQHLQPGGFDAQAAAAAAAGATTSSGLHFPPVKQPVACHSTLTQLRRQPAPADPYRKMHASVSVGVTSVNVSVTVTEGHEAINKWHSRTSIPRSAVACPPTAHIPESFHGSGCTPTATL